MIVGGTAALVAEDVLQEHADDVREPSEVVRGRRVLERPVSDVTPADLERADADLLVAVYRAYAGVGSR